MIPGKVYKWLELNKFAFKKFRFFKIHEKIDKRAAIISSNRSWALSALEALLLFFFLLKELA